MRSARPLFAVAVALIAFANHSLTAAEIAAEITVSPNVINIASASTVVTVHTDIPFNAVVGATVTLNEYLLIDWWKSDNQGNFVAKFEAGAVKGIVEPGTTATLTLRGVTRDDEIFWGEDQVKVIEVKAKK